MPHSIRGSGSDAMTGGTKTLEDSALPPVRSAAGQVFAMLWRDKFALAAALVLLTIVLCALIGPELLGDAASKQNLRGRNPPPFNLSRGWPFILGADALGRPI